MQIHLLNTFHTWHALLQNPYRLPAMFSKQATLQRLQIIIQPQRIGSCHLFNINKQVMYGMWWESTLIILKVWQKCMNLRGGGVKRWSKKYLFKKGKLKRRLGVYLLLRPQGSTLHQTLIWCQFISGYMDISMYILKYWSLFFKFQNLFWWFWRQYWWTNYRKRDWASISGWFIWNWLRLEYLTCGPFVYVNIVTIKAFSGFP